MTTGAEQDGGLPNGVRKLWELREKLERGPKPGLSLERIVTVAIEAADEEGIGALSMARVAKRLGSATMSLYRYVTSKDELQLLMLDMASGKPPALADLAGDWRAGLERWSREFLAVFRRHPWMLQIPLAGPPMEPGQLMWLECGLRTLNGTGLSPVERLSALLLLVGYVRNHAQLALTTPAPVASGDGADSAAGYGPALAALLDANTFPALTELIAAGAFEEPDDDFDFGLHRVLDGIDVLIRTRNGSSPLGHATN
jgi:AcrR family transcriptional regulator